MKLINAYYKITTFIDVTLYKILFGKKFNCKKISCRSGFKILVEKDGKLIIGNGVFFNNNCSITCMKSISIGDNTIFGEGVKIYDHNYHISNSEVLIKNQGHTYGDVIIGNNCWIGSNVVILKGAEIGNNVVIGAGNIINSKIPNNSIVISNNIFEINPIKFKTL